MAKPDMTSEQFLKSGLGSQLRTSRHRTDYKAEFVRQMKDAELPECEREYVFHDKRKWRFDFAFVEQKVAVEYDGGIFDRQPSHSSIAGILRDKEKVTEAQLAGWIVIQITAQQVPDGSALRYVKRALNLRNRGILAPVEQAAKDAARTLRSVADKLESA